MLDFKFYKILLVVCRKEKMINTVNICNIFKLNHNFKLKTLNDFSIVHLKICTVDDNYITS